MGVKQTTRLAIDYGRQRNHLPPAQMLRAAACFDDGR
jgi:hypothetical protein